MQVATIAWFEADSVCGSHSIGIPVALVLPYIFRLFQCLRQYKDTKEKTTLLNGEFTLDFPFLSLIFVLVCSVVFKLTIHMLYVFLSLASSKAFCVIETILTTLTYCFSFKIFDCRTSDFSFSP